MRNRHSLVIIILVYNSAADAVTCINHLLAFPSDYEIVVVDNCSTDGSYEKLCTAYAGQDNVDVIQSESNGGYSAGNNLGIRHALQKHDFDTFAIMNPDVVIPSPAVLDNLLQLIWSHENCLAVGGQPVNHADGDIPWKAGWSISTGKELVCNHFRHAQRQFKNVPLSSGGVTQVDCIAGCFLMAKTIPFLQLGMFDENVFLYNEENILGIKCKRAGYSLLVDTRQTYYHNHARPRRARNSKKGRPLSAEIRQQRYGYESRRYMARTYYDPWLVAPLAIIEILNEACIMAKHAARRHS